MAWSALALFGTQLVFLGFFVFFAFFNYLYGIASLWKPAIKRVKTSGRRIAVVIVCFNEKHVLNETIRACDRLTYPNRLLLVADDSTDSEVANDLRHLALSRGCQKREWAFDFRQPSHSAPPEPDEPIELWESADFVLLRRPSNAGFKAGSLQSVVEYLSARGIDLMYLLDADWHPQSDALERTLEVLEAAENAAFVQTKRLSHPAGMNLFQRYVSIVEEGCYHVDFEGRQVLGHPMLFSGCCALFRLDAINAIGGFTPGHLTEDLDITNRLWLSGWQGIYLGSVVNHGEVPFTYDHYRRQQERWAAGSARAFRDHAWRILTANTLSGMDKLSALRQNAYFTSTLLTGSAILLGIGTVLWILLAWNSYAVECYLYLLNLFKVPLAVLLYWCILSNFIEPVVMILAKRRTYRDLFHLPMTVWYAWGVLPTYMVGNFKGLFGVKLDWFRTPKFLRDKVGDLPQLPISVRTMNAVSCAGLLCFYFVQGWAFGWFDEFALLLVPAFLLSSMK